MRVEHIYDSDIDGGEGLIATVVQLGNPHVVPPGSHWLTADQSPLQAAVMSRKKGEEIAPHMHLPPVLSDPPYSVTQEVLVMYWGSMQVDFYSARGVLVASRILGPYDVVHLHSGGHGFRFLEDTCMMEVKTGPYGGKQADKVLIRK